MPFSRYLAWIQLNSRHSRAKAERADDSLDFAKQIVSAVRAVYPECEAVFTHPNAVIFAVVDSASASDVWNKLAKGVVRGDQLSVLKLGDQIKTTHAGLNAWYLKTAWHMPSQAD